MVIAFEKIQWIPLEFLILALGKHGLVLTPRRISNKLRTPEYQKARFLLILGGFYLCGNGFPTLHGFKVIGPVAAAERARCFLAVFTQLMLL